MNYGNSVLISFSKSFFGRGYPRGVMAKADGLRNRSNRVRTPFAVIRSLSDKFPLGRYEPPFPLRFGLNSTPTVLLEECSGIK